MDKDQIGIAKGRAQAIVNGFATVKNQQARDVVNLAEHAEKQALVIKILESKVEELHDKLKAEMNIKNIFGGYTFG